MAGERFKVGLGSMEVCAPGKEMEVQKVILVSYPAANRIGIQIVDGELRGYVIFIDENAYTAVKQSGKPVNELRVT